jgi:hypothetical protein
MGSKPKPDSGIDPEFWAAHRRWRDRYDAKVAEDRRARLEEALARFEGAVDEYSSVSDALTAAAGTTPAAAEQMIRTRTAGLSDAKFFKSRLMDEPRPAIDESRMKPLRFREYAAERKMWRALCDAVKIDKTMLSRTGPHTDIVDMVRSYQDLGNARFFKRLGAAVAQPSGLHASKEIDAALYALAGHERGYSYPKISKLIARLTGRQEPGADAVRKLLDRHRKLLGVEEKL